MEVEPNKSSRANFFELLPAELDRRVVDIGLPKFRGKQLREWVYGKLVTDVTQMTNLSARDREKVSAALDFEPGKLVKQQISEDGTFKILLQWPRENWPEPALTETVMIPDADRRTACVSSQVGCPVGCKFCASGLLGLKGNLSPGEIIYQLFSLNRMMQPTGHRVTNIVYMGMGEPMSNYPAVMTAIRIMHDPECFGLGARRITVSTVGVPAKIRDLAHEDLSLNLALSLHAPNEPLGQSL
jgi:23S rRNA (adenine2503-C2)-methyltransferase